MGKKIKKPREYFMVTFNEYAGEPGMITEPYWIHRLSSNGDAAQCQVKSQKRLYPATKPRLFTAEQLAASDLKPEDCVDRSGYLKRVRGA